MYLVKRIDRTIILLLFSINIYAQKSDVSITYDNFLRIHYNRNQISITKEQLKIVDNIAQGIKNNKIPERFRFMWQVETCFSELNKNRYIPYDRIEYLLNYIEKQYGIKRDVFLFEFYTSEYCDKAEKFAISSINFTLIEK